MHPNIAIGGVMRLLSWDKKAVDGSARFVLMDKIGSVSHGHVVHSDVIRTALERQRAELGEL
jgi:3-dehydroquinate synthetase